MILSSVVMIVLMLGITVIVQLLKNWELVSERLWLVPTSAVVGAVLVFLLSFGGDIVRQKSPELLSMLGAVIQGAVLGFAASGFYDLVRGIRGQYEE